MKSFFALTQCAAFAASALCVIAANAAVVTTPSGTVVGVAGGVSDTPAADTWLRDNVRAGSTTGITTHFPESGDGSAYMSSSDGLGKADWDYYKTGGFGKLSAIPTYSYEWYRAASSSVAPHLHPVMRLIVDIDGDLGTTDIGYLVFERAYNPSTSPVPVGAWTAETITGTTNLWLSQPGQGIEEVYNRTLADYQSGTYTPTAGWKKITGNSVVIGISLGIGSGWAGTFEGAVDNPTLGAFSSNFEVTAPAVAATPVAVPALDLVGLLALSGALGVTASALARRRRKTDASRSGA